MISNTNYQSPKHILYTHRYWTLLVECLCLTINNLLFLSYAAVANLVDEYYCPTPNCQAANWYATSFQIGAVLAGIVALWIVDKIGLKNGILLGGAITTLGTFLRTISTLPGLGAKTRLGIGLTGQIIAAFAVPLLRYMPPLLANSWFPPNRRAFATTAAFIAGLAGSLLISLIAPLIITKGSIEHIRSGLFILNYGITVCAAIMVFLAYIIVTESRPPTAPSKTAAKRVTLPFWESIKKLFCNRTYILFVFGLGGMVGIRGSLLTLSQQILCPKGYSNVFVGLTGSLFIFGGCLGSVIVSIYVGETKLYTEVLKVCSGLSAVFGCLTAMFSNYPHLEVPIAISAFFFGFLGFPCLPLSAELAVECTYPINPSLSAGILINYGQTFLIVMIYLLIGTTQNASHADEFTEVCTTSGSSRSTVLPFNWKIPLIIWSSLYVFFVFLVIIFFHSRYHRLEAEQSSEETAIEISESEKSSQELSIPLINM